MDAREFFNTLFGPAPAGTLVEWRGVPGPSGLVPASEPIFPVLGLVNTYFGVCPRDRDGQVTVATCAWADIDHPLEGFDPAAVVPTPTIAVATGGGYHLYWCFSSVALAREVVEWCRLMAVVLGSDRAVCDIRRVLRVPGTQNMKYDPPRDVTIVYSDGPLYSPDEFLSRVFATLVGGMWVEGQRHAVALALGALAARAGWTEARVRHVVRVVCEAAGDQEVGDREVAAIGTMVRRDAGVHVTASVIKETLGKDYGILLKAVGISTADGDIVRDGAAVGHTGTLERDMRDLFLEDGGWAWADGGLARWDGSAWSRAANDEILVAVFNMLAGLEVIKSGEQYPYTATARLAGAVASLVRGTLADNPLKPPDGAKIPLENGVLDVETGEIVAPSPEFRNRWVLPVAYDAGANAPRWEAFVLEAAPGEVAHLQEWFGYLLLPSNPWQRMLWLYGPTETGKSTFLRVVTDLFGPASVAISMDRISDYTVATLSGTLVAVCSELSAGTLKTTLFKALVSGDDVVGRHPYGRPFQTRFNGKMVWASNSLPPLDDSEGMWRRIVVVPFTRRPVNPDPLLAVKLNQELPGILNWALGGLVSIHGFLRRGTWELPASVMDMVAEYRDAADTFGRFAHDELVLDSEESVIAIELYTRYRQWSLERGFSPRPLGIHWARGMRGLGLIEEDVAENESVVRYWRGAKLIPGRWDLERR